MKCQDCGKPDVAFDERSRRHPCGPLCIKCERGWTLYHPQDDKDNFVVIPNRDLKIHDDEGTQCWCEPRIEFENGHRIVVHSAMDGREKYEKPADPK